MKTKETKKQKKENVNITCEIRDKMKDKRRRKKEEQITKRNNKA